MYLFENKDHYSHSDIKKIQSIRQNKSHSEAIEKLLNRTQTVNFLFILGFPIKFYKNETHMIDSIDAEIGCDLDDNSLSIKTTNNDIKEALTEI